MGDLGLRSIELRSFELPVSASVAGKYGRRRLGRLIRLESHGGVIGWGEASPLPGFSPESAVDIDGCRDRLAAHLPDLDFGRAHKIPGIPPSLVFAIEQASLSIRAQMTGSTPDLMLGGGQRRSVRINGLVDARPDVAVTEARALVDKGYSAIKFKIADWMPEEVATTLRTVRAEIGLDIEIRLDANRRWTVERAMQSLEPISNLDIAYVEEPVFDPSHLGFLAESIGGRIPVALDESLLSLDPPDLDRFGFAGAVILKPTLLGGLSRAIEWAAEAGKRGMRAVVSSAFESGLATSWLIALASRDELDDIAGLDTIRYLDGDLLQPRLVLGTAVETFACGRALETPIQGE